MWSWLSTIYSSIDDAEPHASRVHYLQLRGFEDHGHATRLLPFKRLRALTYGWCKFEDLPRQCRSLTSLTRLTILNTSLRKFPVWLSKLPHLRKLTIRVTEIRAIPPDIKHIRTLRDFEFVNNDCFTVPHELAELRELRHLNFGSTQIGMIPDAVLDLLRLKLLLPTGTNFTAEEYASDESIPASRRRSRTRGRANTVEVRVRGGEYGGLPVVLAAAAAPWRYSEQRSRSRQQVGASKLPINLRSAKSHGSVIN